MGARPHYILGNTGVVLHHWVVAATLAGWVGGRVGGGGEVGGGGQDVTPLSQTATFYYRQCRRTYLLKDRQDPDEYIKNLDHFQKCWGLFYYYIHIFCIYI